MKKNDTEYLFDLIDLPNYISFEENDKVVEIVKWCKGLTQFIINSLLYNIMYTHDCLQLKEKLLVIRNDLFRHWRSYLIYMETPYYHYDVDDDIALSEEKSLLENNEAKLEKLYDHLRFCKAFAKIKVKDCEKEIVELQKSIKDSQDEIERLEKYIEDKDWSNSPFRRGEWELAAQIITEKIDAICSSIDIMGIRPITNFMPLAKELVHICYKRPFDFNTIDEHIIYSLLTFDDELSPVPIFSKYKSWVLALVFAIADPLDKDDRPYIIEKEAAKEWEEKAIQYFGLLSTLKHRNDLLTRDQNCKKTNNDNRIFYFYHDIRDAIERLQNNG